MGVGLLFEEAGLGGGMAVVASVGVICSVVWHGFVNILWNNVVLIALQGDLPESGGCVTPPSEDYFTIVCYLTPCLVTK